MQSHLEIITAQASQHFSSLLLAYSLFISPFLISASFSLLCTHYNGVITVLFCHNNVITLYRTALPINKKLDCAIRKQERLNSFFVSCVHFSSQQRKRKERKKKKSLPIAALAPNPQELPPAAGQKPASSVHTSQDSSDRLSGCGTNLLWQAISPSVIKTDKSLSQADEEQQIKEYPGYIYII